MKNQNAIERNLVMIATASIAIISCGCLGPRSGILTGDEIKAFRPLLNSERIEKRFGSYGIIVRHQGKNLRISNLYSTEGGKRTTRTWARVVFLTPVHSSAKHTHQKVIEGGSLGATFKAAGWEISKSHFAIQNQDLRGDEAQSIRTAMNLPLTETKIAQLRYLLTLSKGNLKIPYAWIEELYHPSFLRKTDLQQLLPSR